MNKWLIISAIFSVIIIAVIISFALVSNNNNQSESFSAKDKPSTDIILYLEKQDLSLQVGESCALDLSNVPQIYTNIISVFVPDAYSNICIANENIITATKEGSATLTVKCYCSSTNYAVMDINLIVSGLNVAFEYEKHQIAFNQFSISITCETEYFEDKISFNQDNLNLNVLKTNTNEYLVTIYQATNLVINYFGYDAYTVSLSLDYSKIDYKILINQQEVNKENVVLYMYENGEDGIFNSLELIVPTELDFVEFKLDCPLEVSELSVIANKLGTFEAKLFADDFEISSFDILVKEVSITDIILTSVTELHINENYLLKYNVYPLYATYDIDFSCESNKVSISGDNIVISEAGTYQIVAKCGDYQKSFEITAISLATEQENDEYYFKVFARDGSIITDEYTIDIGCNRLLYSTNVNIDSIVIKINDSTDGIQILSDFIELTIDSSGNYEMSVFIEDELLKTIILMC